jgi:hypothetical protein
VKLRDLEARFFQSWIEHHEPGAWVNGVMSPDGVHRYRREVSSLAEAHDIVFLCPLCFQKNGGAKGTHSVLVSFAGREIPDGCGSVGKNGPSRWTIVGGSTLDDLQLTPSILLGGPGCGWHGFIGSSGVPPGEAA